MLQRKITNLHQEMVSQTSRQMHPVAMTEIETLKTRTERTSGKARRYDERSWQNKKYRTKTRNIVISNNNIKQKIHAEANTFEKEKTSFNNTYAKRFVLSHELVLYLNILRSRQPSVPSIPDNCSWATSNQYQHLLQI